MNELEYKYQYLQDILRTLGSVAVAFSGGVDSTFLLKVAQNVLGDKAIAVAASSCSFPERELRAAQDFCKLKAFGFSYVTLDLLGYRTGSMNETLGERSGA